MIHLRARVCAQLLHAQVSALESNLSDFGGSGDLAHSMYDQEQRKQQQRPSTASVDGKDRCAQCMSSCILHLLIVHKYL
jgi:hypothetical protein